MAKAKTALVKTINGDFEISFINSRDFVNGLRTSIERGVLYEFQNGNTRTFLNCKNIVSIELEAEQSISSPFKQLPVIELDTAEEIRANQLAMQPDISKFEAKAKAMQDLKAKEDAARQRQFDQIYGAQQEAPVAKKPGRPAKTN